VVRSNRAPGVNVSDPSDTSRNDQSHSMFTRFDAANQLDEAQLSLAENILESASTAMRDAEEVSTSVDLETNSAPLSSHFTNSVSPEATDEAVTESIHSGDGGEPDPIDWAFFVPTSCSEHGQRLIYVDDGIVDMEKGGKDEMVDNVKW
jgi:hypothetical protein